MQLGLGTVSFGVDYGLANHGEVDANSVNSIIESATEAGIQLIDTANLYGDAEQKLGATNHMAEFSVISKLPSVAKLSDQDVEDVWHLTCQNLKIEKTYGCLLHRVQDLLTPDDPTQSFQNYDKVLRLKELNLTDKIGVSVYTPQELESIIAHFDIDIVQLPMNVFDQRFKQSGVLEKTKNKGIEIHVRSAFLQGLLLMDTKQINAYFNRYLPHIAKYFEFLSAIGLTKLQGALAMLNQEQCIDYTIIGCHNIQQLNEINTAFKQIKNHNTQFDFSLFNHHDESFILPTQWRTL